MRKHHLPRLVFGACTAAALLVLTGTANATAPGCPVTYAKLKAALVAADTADSTGFNHHYWAVVVNNDGVVCAVAFSGPKTRSQWIASRQIAAAKAFTAYGLSLDVGTGIGPLSTANLYEKVQPGITPEVAPLFGLAGGNVLDAAAAYKGEYGLFGTEADPMIGARVGGTITFGGGLGLYVGNTRVGGLGISGDTACADHSVAWRTRILLGIQPPTGLADGIHFATTANPLDGHPHCYNDGDTKGVN